MHCLISYLLFSDTYTFTINLPDRKTISENADSVQDLFTVDCTATITITILSALVPTEVSCSSCWISTNPDSDVFYMSGKLNMKLLR